MVDLALRDASAAVSSPPDRLRLLGRLRLIDGSFRTIYARFGSSKQYPEYNPSRFAVSRDGKTLVAGCNGCCTIDVKTGKVTHAFDRIRPQDFQD